MRQPRPSTSLDSSTLGWNLALVVKTGTNPAAIADTIRRAIAEVDATQAITDVKTVVELETDDVASARLRSALLSAFGGVAMLLAALGLYGVMAFFVVEQTREIGIRAALGATATTLLGLVLRQGVTIIAAGLASGLIVSLGTGRLLKAFLFGVGPIDSMTLVGVAALLTLAALVACYLPARRATRIDPMIVLKSE